jgi:hypothetical protein
MLKKRIPTIVGLLLLILGTVGGVVFINKGTDFLPRAAPEFAPQKVKITNVSENGFVVSWITQESTIGFIRFGNTASNLTTTVTDDRDLLAGASGDYRSHYITLQNLKPGTTYYFKLGSQNNQLYDNNGQPFAITTPLTLNTPPTADTAYGTVVTPANTPAEGSIIYLMLEGATPISALVKQNGSWAASISTARTTDLSSYVSYDPHQARLDILVQPGMGEPAKIITTTGNDQPVPTITLGQTSDFSNALSASPTPAPIDEPRVVSSTPLPQSKMSIQPLETIANDSSLMITSIPTDGTIVKTSQPAIKGKAPANTTVIISVHSPIGYTDQVQVDSSGKWQWTPPTNLEPGEHTVTVSYTDEEGILHKMSRTFVINTAGTSVEVNSLTPSYSATPSATAKPTATPKPTQKPTPTPTPSPRSTVATRSATLVAGSTNATIFPLLLGLTFLTLGWKLLLPRR